MTTDLTYKRNMPNPRAPNLVFETEPNVWGLQTNEWKLVFDSEKNTEEKKEISNREVN